MGNPSLRLSEVLIDNCLSYCRNLRFVGKTLTLLCLSTATWQSWLLNIIALMKCVKIITQKANIDFALKLTILKQGQ